jgi:hypothetical protein
MNLYFSWIFFKLLSILSFSIILFDFYLTLLFYYTIYFNLLFSEAFYIYYFFNEVSLKFYFDFYLLSTLLILVSLLRYFFIIFILLFKSFKVSFLFFDTDIISYITFRPEVEFHFECDFSLYFLSLTLPLLLFNKTELKQLELFIFENYWFLFLINIFLNSCWQVF